jgi:hypothetical protein
MRKKGLIVLVLLVVSLAAGVRDAGALPANEVWDTFFLCSGEEVGWRILMCSGVVQTSGQQSGDYKLRERTNCTTGYYTSDWYYWNGSGWTWFSGNPVPNCV